MQPVLQAALLLGVAFGVGAACATAPRFGAVAPAEACKAARSGTAAFAGADLANGQALFDRDCEECHSLVDDKTRPKGPTLHGIVSRRVGAVGGFRYSKAFRDRSDTWTLDALDRYIEDPSWSYPGTRMRFSGMRSADDRRDVIALLACRTR